MPRVLLALVWMAGLIVVSAMPAAAQSSADDCTCRPFWQVVAAALLGALVATLIWLLATRWRRLFNR